MKKSYKKPEIEVIEFDCEDVITTISIELPMHPSN
jgi:hypothetical protein